MIEGVATETLKSEQVNKQNVNNTKFSSQLLPQFNLKVTLATMFVRVQINANKNLHHYEPYKVEKRPHYNHIRN